MFQNNLKIALRSLTKNKGFSLINILGLSVGMAVAIMIGLWLHDELTFNKFHGNPDRLVQFRTHYYHNGVFRSGNATPAPLANEMRQRFGDDFELISSTSWNGEQVLKVGNKSLLRRGMAVEKDFPPMINTQFISGDTKNLFNDPSSVVLSNALAEAFFGAQDPIGQIIEINNERKYKVTGVFENYPKNSSFNEVDFYITWADYSKNTWVANSLNTWDNHSFQTFALLSKNTSIATVDSKIKNIEEEFIEGNYQPQLFVHPIKNWHLYNEFENKVNIGGRIQYVWLFGIIGLFVLLLACINFMNLSTAQSEKRAKEVGVRKTVGSGRGNLIMQFLTQSLLVVSIALVFALLLAQLCLPVFNELADKQVAILWSSPIFWTGIIGFALLTGLLAGSYPAFYLSSFEPLRVLKGTFKAGKGGSLPRKALVVIQFTVSIALIIGTLIVFQQINHAKNRPIGYDRSNIIQIHMHTNELDGKYDQLRAELQQSRAVKDISHSNGPITGVWSNQGGLTWEGHNPDEPFSFAYVGCTYDYGNTIDWEIVEGRDFSRDYGTDTSAIILNQTAANMIGIENLAGKTLTYHERPTKVVGIVKDILMESPYTPVKPTLYQLNMDWANMWFMRLSDDMPTQQALQKIESTFSQIAPNSPFEYTFVDSDYSEKFDYEERIGKLARIFAFLAIFISCLGLFGLSAYVVERRTKEIGIRKVLGASVLNLWAMLSKEFIFLVTFSCLIAIPLAYYYLNDWLSTYEYRIEIGWSVFVLAGVLAIGVTVLTVSFQSIKAALSNPVEAIQNE